MRETTDQPIFGPYADAPAVAVGPADGARQHEQRAARVALEVVGRAAEHQAPQRAVST